MALDPNARLIITATDATRAAWDAATRTANAGASKISGALKGAFAGLSVAALGAGITKLVTQSLEYGEAIGKAAIKSGLTSEAISELAFAAKGADIGIDELSKSIGTMQVNISKAEGGSKALSDAFDELGVDFAAFRQIKADRQFEVLAEAISRVPDEADKARLATEIFGKSGAQLLPLFSDGAEGIRKAREEAERLGLSLSTEQQQKLQAAADGLGKMKQAAAGLATELTVALAPGITLITDKLSKFIERLNRVDVSKLGEDIAALDARISRAESAKDDSGLEQFLKGTAAAAAEDIPALRAALAEKRALLESERKKLQEFGKEEGGSDIDDLLGNKKRSDLGSLIPGLLQGPDSDVRAEIERQARLRDLALEGEVERNRVLDDAQGRGVQGERRERMLEEEREYFEKLQGIVEDNAEQTTQASEAILDEYSDRLTEKVMERNAVLEGAAAEFGRSVQSSLSDVFYNAGKGADSFASSVLNAFKRILADAAAQKVVSLLGGLLGGKKDPGVGGGSSTGGLFASAIGALFGGARAEGGPVSSGMGYLVGERGPELFLPGQSGSIVPNSAMAGSNIRIDARVSIDARGATKDGAQELMSQLPAILDQRDRRLRDGIRDDINRNRFGLK